MVALFVSANPGGSHFHWEGLNIWVGHPECRVVYWQGWLTLLLNLFPLVNKRDITVADGKF